MDSFRDRLEYFMKLRNIKAKRLSKLAGLHETYVRDLLKRTDNPSLDKILKLCAVLDIYPHELVPDLNKLYPAEAVKLLQELVEIRERKRDINSKIEALKG